MMGKWSGAVCCTVAAIALLLVAGLANSDENYSIFGTITDQDGSPVPGVALSFQDALPSQMTDRDGRYRVSDAEAGQTHTIMPSRAGLSFSPASRVVTMGSGDERVDFRATAEGVSDKIPVPVPLSVYPTSGETWEQGKAYRIQWTYEGTNDVRIRLHQGAAYDLVKWITAGTPNDGSFWWKVPANIPPGNDYAIVMDEGYYGSITEPITIKQMPLVTYPNTASVSWRRGQPYKIKWQGFGGSHVKIQLYRAGSLNRLISWATPNDGSFWWKVPDTQAKGTTFKIKITGQSKTAVYDFSDKNFTIAGDQKVTWPTAPGISWPHGQAQAIKWQGYVGPGVRIELLKNWSLAKVVTADTPNDGQFWLKMPWSTTPGADYRIRIISTNDPTQKDHSNNSFTVVSVPHVMYPSASGIEWDVGDEVVITWQGFDCATVRIYLLRWGAFSDMISPGTTNDGSYTWHVPNGTATGGGFKVKVRPQPIGSMEESDHHFRINPQQ